jgi:hypothetical protein
MRRFVALTVPLLVALVAVAGPAGACGGLVAPNGSVQLLRTTTLAAHVDGVEHYVTSFAFASPEDSFGSIIPLPAEPTTVERAGDWTLQRLVQEVTPAVEELAAFDTVASSEGDSVVVLQHHQIDSLDVTIVRGGGAEVAAWAEEQGFAISDDAPEVLDFYSERSPYFLAARFDADLAVADDFREGDAIPIHLAIPTEDPWVPIRILALDKPGSEIVSADVFLLTDHRPALLGPDALVQERSEPASDLLLDDLRSDRHSRWVPDEAWFTYLRLEAPASELTGDLAVDVDGIFPSPVAAGQASDVSPISVSPDSIGGHVLGDAMPVLLLLAAAVALVVVADRRFAHRPRSGA